MILIFSFSDKEQHIWIKKFLKYQVLGVSVWGVRTNGARGWKANCFNGDWSGHIWGFLGTNMTLQNYIKL